MSLLFCESFEGLTTTMLSSRFSSIGSTSYNTISSAHSRTGSKSLLINNNIGYVRIPVTANPFIIGFAFKTIEITPTINTTWLSILNSTFNAQCSIGHDALVNLFFYNSSTLGINSKNIYTYNIWNYLEIKVTISNSVSTDDCIIRANNEEILNLPSGDTQGQSTDALSYIQLKCLHNHIDTCFDDIYICDTNGSTCNNFLGDIKVETLYPNGNGNSNDFVGSDADSTDNYLLVDEANPDDDTTYVEADTAGNKDLYTYGNLSSTPNNIYATSVISKNKLDSAGSNTGKLLCRSNSTDYESGVFSPTTTYAIVERIWEIDPNTSAPWIEAGINAAEFGIKVES